MKALRQFEMDGPSPVSAPQRPLASVSRATLERLEGLGHGGIFVLDLHRRRFDYIAPDLARMVGQPAEPDIDLDAVSARIHADDLEIVGAFFASLQPGDDAPVPSMTLRLARPERGWRWLEARARALTFQPDGKPHTVIGVVIDITEQRATARALDRAARAVLRAGDEERRRVARNLHDSTAQHLVAIDLCLSGLARRIPPSPETAAIMRDIREALGAAHREVRTYSYLLHPPQLQRLGLEDALRRLVDGFDRRSELAIELEVAGAPQRASAETELALFRVAQEAIMNIHRHAQATRATVRLLRSPGTIVLEVQDDGIGLPPDVEFASPSGDGVGIPGMQTRLAQMGGVLELITSQEGLTLRAEIPL